MINKSSFKYTNTLEQVILLKLKLTFVNGFVSNIPLKVKWSFRDAAKLKTERETLIINF